MAKMNYELAKELKEAGFPTRTMVATNLRIIGDEWLEPRLEQLIEACGDKFYTLSRAKDIDDGLIWVASGEDEPLEPFIELAKTPKEAVAKLWLKLNE